MTEHPKLTVYDADSCTVYVPFISEDGRVGYRVVDNAFAGRETFIYLNPSSGSDDGVPTVFVYIGGDNDPAVDGAVQHYDLRDALGR